jgi:hypothetical protein
MTTKPNFDRDIENALDALDAVIASGEFKDRNEELQAARDMIQWADDIISQVTNGSHRGPTDRMLHAWRGIFDDVSA